jgi:hypothetical protein
MESGILYFKHVRSSNKAVGAIKPVFAYQVWARLLRINMI